MSVLESLLATAPEAGGWQAARDSHRAIALRNGLPDRRQENWKYTGLRPLQGRNFQAAANAQTLLQPEDLAQALAERNIPQLASQRLTFVGGAYAPALSHGDQIKGLVLTPLSQLSEASAAIAANYLAVTYEGRDEGFAALNTALASDGALVQVSAAEHGEQLAPVLELLFIDLAGDGPKAQAVRNLLVLDDHAELTLIERYITLGDDLGDEAPEAGGGNLINSLSQITVGAGARLNHLQLPLLGRSSVLISRTDVEVGAGANYASSGLDISGELVRHDLNVAMTGEGGHASLAGVYAPSGNTHVDIHCLIDHRQPNATSTQNFRGVLRDHSRGVFNGKVVVREGADGTDASQSNNNLLLSENAEIDTKPELEIYADDVKCAHGTTVGALSEEHLFYLTARGIAPDQARQMLTAAFCRQVLEPIASEPLRQHALAQLEHHLQESTP